MDVQSRRDISRTVEDFLSANRKSYMPRRLAQQRMTFSDLGWPFHARCLCSSWACCCVDWWHKSSDAPTCMTAISLALSIQLRPAYKWRDSVYEVLW